MLEARLDKIPNYIKAKSPQGLRRLMLANNVRHATEFRYSIIFANGEWYAWYYLTTDFKEVSE